MNTSLEIIHVDFTDLEIRDELDGLTKVTSAAFVSALQQPKAIGKDGNVDFNRLARRIGVTENVARSMMQRAQASFGDHFNGRKHRR